MLKIHPTAVISPKVTLGNNVVIGPFCVLEDEVVIGNGCRLEGHVVVKEGTLLGDDNEISENSVLGGKPQHLHAPNRTGRLVIGAGNRIRENVTIHRALGEGEVTHIGDNNLIMVNAHVAHDCVVGSNTILTNNVMLAGHVAIGDYAYLSGAVAVHQFCRIGRHAMVGGQAAVKHDVPPYVTVDGASNRIVGLNLIGLRRRGFTSDQIAQLKAAYRLIYRSGKKIPQVLEVLIRQFDAGPAADFYPFLTESKRGFMQERRASTPTLRVFKDHIKDNPNADVKRAA